MNTSYTTYKQKIHSYCLQRGSAIPDKQGENSETLCQKYTPVEHCGASYVPTSSYWTLYDNRGWMQSA